MISIKKLNLLYNVEFDKFSINKSEVSTAKSKHDMDKY